MHAVYSDSIIKIDYSDNSNRIIKINPSENADSII